MKDYLLFHVVTGQLFAVESDNKTYSHRPDRATTTDGVNLRFVVADFNSRFNPNGVYAVCEGFPANDLMNPPSGKELDQSLEDLRPVNETVQEYVERFKGDKVEAWRIAVLTDWSPRLLSEKEEDAASTRGMLTMLKFMR